MDFKEPYNRQALIYSVVVSSSEQLGEIGYIGKKIRFFFFLLTGHISVSLRHSTNFLIPPDRLINIMSGHQFGNEKREKVTGLLALLS